MREVHVITVSHRHGLDVWVGETKGAAFQELEVYVRDWWSDCYDTDIPTDKTGMDLIDDYFFDNPREEWYDYRVLNVLVFNEKVGFNEG